MASRNMLPDTVTLYNYAGEINDVATYEKTIIEHVRCAVTKTTDLDKQGKKVGDFARLYIFDKASSAKSEDGNEKAYMPYDDWLEADNKAAYWTLGDGEDFFVAGRCEESIPPNQGNVFRIRSGKHLHAGSRRMWHWHIEGK